MNVSLYLFVCLFVYFRVSVFVCNCEQTKWKLLFSNIMQKMRNIMQIEKKKQKHSKIN